MRNVNLILPDDDAELAENDRGQKRHGNVPQFEARDLAGGETPRQREDDQELWVGAQGCY